MNQGETANFILLSNTKIRKSWATKKDHQHSSSQALLCMQSQWFAKADFQAHPRGLHSQEALGAS